MPDAPIRAARLHEIDAETLYRILQLRVDVFVVEQKCAYPELDGRDLEADTWQLWAEKDGVVLATCRLLTDPSGAARIGRVATAPSARSSGLAKRLMRQALELAGSREVVLDAQSYLVEWYGRLGFEAAGEQFVEDGIPHVPMRRRSA